MNSKIEKARARNRRNSAAWKKANPERAKAFVERWRKAHPDYETLQYREHPERSLFRSARGRARKRKLVFDLVVTDIFIPKLCPVLGIPLIHGTGKMSDNSPTVDRVKPALGYTRDNIWVISNRANRMKNDATLIELKLLVKALEAK